MENTKKYSVEEKRAYYVGVGAGIGCGQVKNVQRIMKQMSPEEKASFKNGFDKGAVQRKWKGKSKGR